MTALVYGSLLLIVAFLLHLIWWRIHLPVRQSKCIVVLFTSVLLAGSFVLCMFPGKTTLWSLNPPKDLPGFLQTWLFFMSMTMAYLITYSAIEADSPSLVMILKIADAGPSGLDVSEFEQSMNDRILVEPRIEDLVTDRMAMMDGNRYQLTRKGRLMARLFQFHRSLMLLDKGA